MISLFWTLVTTLFLSPARVWANHQHRRATPMFEDIERARRVLGRSVEVLLTRDGIELNGIRYRDAAIITALLDNLGSVQKPRGRRKDNSITMLVKARINPGNIDTIQVYDPVAEAWRTLPSTQPAYTDRLSEREHKEFRRQAKRRNEPFSSQAHRLRSKKRTMNLIAELAPQVAFQQRRDMAALWQSQQVEKLAGRPFRMPADLQAASLAPQATFECGRADKGVRIKAKSAPKAWSPSHVDEHGGESSPDYSDINWDGIAMPVPSDLPLEGGVYGEDRA